MSSGAKRWVRPTDTTQSNFIAIHIGGESDDPWPPRLSGPPGCAADCSTAEDVKSFEDRIEGQLAHGEMGLVSGGFAGLRRQPMLLAGYVRADGEKVWINGLASTPAALDTLRTVLRTIRTSGRE